MKDRTKRSLGVSCAGKGSSNRVKDFKSFYENYESINWKKNKKKTREELIDYINNKGRVNEK